jgi:hypothetical protein
VSEEQIALLRAPIPSLGQDEGRKQAPKTRRASETKALRARRNLEGLIAWAAAQRAPKAGHVSPMVSESRSRPRAECREKGMTGSVGSPLVATGRIARDVFKAWMPSGQRSGQRREANLGRSDRSQPVVSEKSWGEGLIKEAHGSPPVAGAGSGSSSQKLTVAPRATLEMCRAGAKTRHSARQAGVRSSPFQAAGTRQSTGGCGGAVDVEAPVAGEPAAGWAGAP